MRPLSFLMAALIALLLIAAGARPVRTDATEYTLVDLGTLPGGNASVALGLNAGNQVVGYSRNGLTDPLFGIPALHAFLWTPADAEATSGTMVDLGTLGGTNSRALAINAMGQVVGVAQDAAGNSRAFLWQPSSPNATTGTMIDLGALPGGTLSNAQDINDLGQIVGSSNGTPGGGFLWTPTTPNAATGTMTSLGDVVPSGINAAGAICGGTNVPANPQLPFLWTPSTPNGTTGTMADLGLAAGATQGFAFDLNNSGHVVGYDIFPPTFHTRAFVASVSGATVTRTSVGTLGGASSGLAAINDAADGLPVTAVGQSPTAAGLVHGIRFRPSAGSRPARRPLAEELSPDDLDQLLLNAAGFALTQGNDINNKGAIAGTAVNLSDEERAALLKRLVPKPVLELSVLSTGDLFAREYTSFRLRVKNPTSTPMDLRVRISGFATTGGFSGVYPKNLFEAESEWPGATFTGGGAGVELTVQGTVAAGDEVFVTFDALNGIVDAAGRLAVAAEDQNTGAKASAAVDYLEARDPPLDVSDFFDILFTALNERFGKASTTATATYARPVMNAARAPALKGPFYLVFDNLQNATLDRSSGVSRRTPFGSPYLKLKPKSVKLGKKIKTKVTFRRKPGTTGPITYTVRILAGAGTP